jgi:hypothetical protein
LQRRSRVFYRNPDDDVGRLFFGHRWSIRRAFDTRAVNGIAPAKAGTPREQAAQVFGAHHGTTLGSACEAEGARAIGSVTLNIAVRKKRSSR